MRLIDTDALIEDLEFDIELNQRALDNGDIDHSAREIMQFDKDCKQNAVSLLREAPTVEAEPIRHGHWIRKGLRWYCSACGNGAFKTDFVFGARYCPICGAKMDERKKNER